MFIRICWDLSTHCVSQAHILPFFFHVITLVFLVVFWALFVFWMETTLNGTWVYKDREEQKVYTCMYNIYEYVCIYIYIYIYIHVSGHSIYLLCIKIYLACYLVSWYCLIYIWHIFYKFYHFDLDYLKDTHLSWWSWCLLVL